MAIDSQSSAPPAAKQFADEDIGNTDLVIQLLTEIRDGQRQSLDMMRETTLKARRAARMAIPVMIVSFLVIALVPLVPLYFQMTRTRSAVPLPARAPVVSPR
jgi:hypothetical protein